MAFDLNSRNKVELLGNVGTEITFDNLPDGRRVANFSLCTNEGYTDDKGERKEFPVWHRCTAYGPIAERLEKSGVKSGSKVLIEGRMRYTERKAEKDGVQHVYHNATVLVEESLNLTPKAAA
jgi:single-strand DNA-binding protein